jgi:hypothetical protein
MDTRIISKKIIELRHSRVMLDFHLAELYGVETRVLKQAVRRNLKRFPHDFMFQLTKDEWQEVITSCDNLPANAKFSPAVPFAFTEQGVAMLSSVLKSEKAVQVNIAIIESVCSPPAVSHGLPGTATADRKTRKGYEPQVQRHT